MRPSRLLRTLITIGAVALLAVACGASGDQAATVSEPVNTDRTEPPNTAPSITPGETTVGAVEIDGETIDYAVTVPADFTMGDTAPLLLAFPPGGQDIGLAARFVEGTYAPEAQARGWVVVSPAAPGGTLFFRGSERLVPGLLDWVETWVVPEGGTPHVAGVSNGGISSFRYAAQNPDRVQSIVTLPGFPQTDTDQQALDQLADVPVRMYVGETDTQWIGPAEDARDRLVQLGGDVELTIFPGEGHVMTSTADGSLIFEQLDSFR